MLIMIKNCCDDNVQQSLLTYDEKINLNEIKNKEIKVMNVVDKISSVNTDDYDWPINNVYINKAEIID